MSKFTTEEKRKYLFKNHLKNHLLEYILDFIGPIILTGIILHIAKAEEFLSGLIIAIAYSLGKLTYNLHHYKKEYINVDIK